MQRLQKQWTARGVVWFTVISSAPRKQGYVTASEENEYLAKISKQRQIISDRRNFTAFRSSFELIIRSFQA